MSQPEVLERMLNKLPNNGAWFGANKAPKVTAMMGIRATEVSDLQDLAMWSKKAVFLMRSENDACDLWGRDVEIPRFVGETDSDFRTRIQAEILRSRNSIPAIEKGISDILKLVSDVYEPWRDVLRFGQHSKLGRHKLCGRYYTNATIDAKMEGYSEKAVEVIERLRACGVRPFYTWVFSGGIDISVNFIMSGQTILQDLAAVERHDTIHGAGLYDAEDTFICEVIDPNAPTFRTDGILGYDRTPPQEG